MENPLDKLGDRTYAIRHNPNCHKPFELRMVGNLAKIEYNASDLVVCDDTLEEAVEKMLVLLRVTNVHRQDPLTMEEARVLYNEFWSLLILHNSDKQRQFAFLNTCYSCEEPAVGRSSTNCWGTVLDYPTCWSCHNKYDRKWMDSVPYKRKCSNPKASCDTVPS